MTEYGIRAWANTESVGAPPSDNGLEFPALVDRFPDAEPAERRLSVVLESSDARFENYDLIEFVEQGGYAMCPHCGSVLAEI